MAKNCHLRADTLDGASGIVGLDSGPGLRQDSPGNGERAGADRDAGDVPMVMERSVMAVQRHLRDRDAVLRRAHGPAETMTLPTMPPS